jgi:hypothetical protein
LTVTFITGLVSTSFSFSEYIPHTKKGEASHPERLVIKVAVMNNRKKMKRPLLSLETLYKYHFFIFTSLKVENSC